MGCMAAAAAAATVTLGTMIITCYGNVERGSQNGSLSVMGSLSYINTLSMFVWQGCTVAAASVSFHRA